MSKGVKKKGFTLVELVVVLAIFGLLASITGLGLYSWTRYSINKENNENARTIFLAAQESLTHMQASGTLSEYSNLVVSDADKTPTASISPEISENISDRLYTIFYTPGSLEYRTLNTNELVRKMLSPYLEGTDVFNHAFAIEFDPRDGVVYSVFYSKKADSLEYETDGNTKESGIVGIAKRDSGTLKDRLLGYYVADLTDIRPTQGPQIIVTEPLTPKPLLVNEEELYVHFDLGADYQEFEKYDYEIKIYSPSDPEPIVTLNIPNKEVYSIKSGKSKTVSASAVYGDGKKNDIRLKAEIRKNCFDKNCFDVILDAVDIQTLSKYEHLRLHDNGKIKIINGEKNNKTDFSSFKDTYSIFNVFQSNEIINFYSIYCDVSVRVVDTKGTQSLINKTSGVEDIMYAGRTIDGNGNNKKMTIDIKYMRHLFNIAYWEKIKNNSDNKLNNSDNKLVINYNQKNDLDFSIAHIYNSASNSDDNINTFIPIPVLYDNSSYEGNGNKIQNLKFDSKILGTMNVGIFGINRGSISNLNLNNATLNSEISNDDYGTGLIAGKNENIISGIVVTLTGNVNKNAGGIVGINEGTIDNCVANGEIAGDSNVGGISGLNIGINNIWYQQNKGIVSECNSSVYIYAENLGSSNLGGIVGKNEKQALVEKCEYISSRNLNKVIDSFETNPFSCGESAGKEYLLYGENVGGIIGYNLSGRIINCKALAEYPDNNGYILGYKNIGGIIGRDDNKVSSNQDYYINNNKNSLNIIGVQQLGGIVGSLEGGQDDKSSAHNNITIAECINYGVTVLVKEDEVSNKTLDAKLAGGITSWLGKNGEIKDCTVAIDINDANKTELLKFSNGDYVGGITGLNRGKIYTYNSNIEHTVLVAGDDYVGGLVGINEGASPDNTDYNDNRPCEIKNQLITSGIVNGDNYVGGMIGVNQKDINIANSEIDGVVVVGNNYVGGLIGWNRRNLQSDNSPVHDIISVTGVDFVGGLIGLNDDKTVYRQRVNVTGGIEGNNYVGGLIGQNLGIIELDSLQNININEVSGSNYIGGLVGKNGDLSDEGSDSKNSIFSYILEYSITSSNVSGTGENIGGIAGYNYGKISTSGTGNNSVKVSGKQNIGGLVGYNCVSSIVDNQTVKNSLVSGTVENVGGLFGYNDGAISFYNDSGSTNVVKVECDADNVGGLAGYNDKNGFFVSTYLSNDSTIKGKDYVGWLAGYNAGNIYSADLNNPTDYNKQISNIVNVEGNKYVGGLAGLNEIGNVCQKVVGGTVTGNNYVGGAYGCYKDKNNINITISTNIEDVTVKGNNIGGLTGCFDIGSGVVVNIKSYALSSTLKGSNAGGTVSVVEKNNTLQVSTISNVQIEIESGNAGGIAAINYGTITNSTIKGSILTYKNNSCNVGAIAAINEGIISDVISINNVLINSDSVSPLSEGVVASNAGRLVGINGSIYKLNNNNIKIEQCKVVNLINDGEILKDLIGLNVSGYVENYHFESNDNNNISAALNNNIGNTNGVTIEEPVKNGNKWNFSFNTVNDSDNKYLLKVYSLYAHNGIVEQSLLKESDYPTAGTEWIRNDNNYTYTLTLDSAENINGFRIQVDHYYNNDNWNDLKYCTITEKSYFFNVSLPDVDYSVVRSDDKEHFTVGFSPIATPDNDYIKNYSLVYKLNDSLYELDFDNGKTNIELDLSEYTGKKVKFSVIAKVVDGDSVYKNSDIIWSQEFDVGEVIQISSLQEENNSNENIVPVIQETQINNEEGENENETVTQE